MERTQQRRSAVVPVLTGIAFVASALVWTFSWAVPNRPSLESLQSAAEIVAVTSPAIMIAGSLLFATASVTDGVIERGWKTGFLSSGFILLFTISFIAAVRTMLATTVDAALNAFEVSLAGTLVLIVYLAVYAFTRVD